MKKSSILKVLVVVGLSMVLIANLVSVVSADDAFSGWTNPTPTGNTTPAANTTNTTPAGNTVTTGNTVTGGNTISTGNTTNTTNTNTTISTGNVTTNLNTTNTKSTNNTSVNSLAYTGIENTSVLTVVMILGVIVAAYSFKKIKEYNNI